MTQKKGKLTPTHPGEILMQEFLKPMSISQYGLANSLGFPPRRINEIVKGKRGISADTALRLARFFGMSDRFWINLQARYDLELTKDRLGNRLEKEVLVLRAKSEVSHQIIGRPLSKMGPGEAIPSTR